MSSFLDSGVDVEVKEENGKSVLEVSLGFYFMTKVVGFISDKIFSLREHESEVGEVSSNYLANPSPFRSEHPGIKKNICI